MSRWFQSAFSIRARPTVGTIPAILAVAFLTLAVASATASTLYADFSLAHWQYYKPLALPTSLTEQTLVEAPLDREVYRGSNAGQTDLRLIEGRDREVPYQLLVQRSRTSREALIVSLRDLGHMPGEFTSFVADLGEGPELHNEVRIEGRGKNFRLDATVETSSDGEEWAVVREDAEIYDFTSGDGRFNARHTEIAYPRSAARYLRVKVLEADASSLEITGAWVFLTETSPAVESAYTPESVSRTESPDDQVTLYELDLGTEGIPLSRVSFMAGTDNFYRSVSIEGRENGGDWLWLAGTEVYSFDTAKFRGSQLEIEFPENLFGQYRLVVEDEDNAPLDFSSFAFYGIDRKLLFQPESGSTYSLYYGNPLASAPSYELERIVPYLETEGLPTASLGSQAVNEEYSGLDVPLTERLPWLMPLAVSLAALVVALLLYGVIRQARKVLPPPREESNN